MNNKNKNTSSGLHTRRTSQYVRRVAVFTRRIDMSGAMQDLQTVGRQKRNGLKQYFGTVSRLWRSIDARHRVAWRAANAAMALVLVVSVVAPFASDLFPSKRYRLSQDTINLVGKNNAALSSKLTYNLQTQTYEFNKEAIKDYNPADALKQQVGGTDDKTKSLYALDVPADPKQGVTYHDVNSQLSFKLVPQFSSLPAKTEQGRVVFPLDGGQQAVYTLKNNGLKEDIVVTANTQDSLRFSYKLELPKSLEARPLQDGSGAIGIYGADSVLFDNISYGSAADQEAVQKAREKAAKTNLVFGIPAPVITTLNAGPKGQAQARFELKDNTLTVIADKLTDIKGSFSIDPSVVITSTSEFGTGNNEGNIDFNSADQITRAKVNGGTIGPWSDPTTSGATTLTTNRVFAGTASYNGYLYGVSGGVGGTGTNDIAYAPICTGPSSNPTQGCGASAAAGKLGNWTSTTGSYNLPGNQLDTASVVTYNGYLYVLGGGNGSNSSFINTYYAQICTGANTTVQFGSSSTATDTGDCTTSSDPGSLSYFNAGAGLQTAIAKAQSAVYNGYLYVMGGCRQLWINCTNGISDTTSNLVQIAKIKADGSHEAFTTNGGVTLSAARQAGAAVAYNGKMYIMGGCSFNYGTCTGNTGGRRTDTLYASINASDGTIGATWTTAAAVIPTPQIELGATVYNGYLYFYQSGGGAFAPYYAQVNSDGSTGTIRATTSYAGSGGQPRQTLTVNGYTYLLGNASGNTVQYSQVDSVGAVARFTTSGNTAFTTSRRGSQTVAYNNRLYVIGGDDGGAPVNSIYVATIGTDGSVGNFAASAATMSTARTFFKALMYGDYMVIVGGCTNTYTSCGTSGSVTTVEKRQIASDGTFSGSWSSQTALGTARYGLNAVISQNKLIVMGGYTTTTALGSIEYASIDSSAALTSGWSNSGVSLPSNRAYFGAVASSTYLYVVGGCTGTGPTGCNSTLADAYRAPLDASGDPLSTFINTGNGSTYYTTRGQFDLSIWNDNLYVTGGIDNATYYNNVFYAPINFSDGSIGNWAASADVTLATGIAGAGTATYNGYIYVAGGYDATNRKNTTQFALLNNGGSGNITSWATTSNISTLTPRYGHQVIAYSGYIYVLGGYASGGTPVSGVNQVLFATINTDGTLGAWASAGTGYSNPADGAAFIANNGFMYRMGGGGTYVQSAVINANGTLGTWGTANVAGLVSSRERHEAAVYNGYLYIFGGCSTVALNPVCRNGATSAATPEVESAQITGGGSTTGAWTTSSANDMPVGLAEHQIVQYGQYVYALGGCMTYNAGTGNCVSLSNSTYMAKFDGSGGLMSDAGCGTTWCTQANFSVPRSGSAATAYGGYLYLLGGTGTGSTFFSDTQIAPIYADGSIGRWNTASTGFTTARFNFGSVAYSNGYLYMVAGCSNGAANCASGIQSDVQYTLPQSIPRKSTYSKLIEFSQNTNISGMTYNGSNASLSYRVAPASALFGSTGASSSLAPTGTCTGNAQNTRYIQVIVALDDSLTATYGESSGSAVTDFTVFYNYVHPPPNIRLRLGQTLQKGVLSPFDTCGSMPT